jgi:SAM-dependent methyltransferase
MTRPCPICLSPSRILVFSMSYLIPDGWTLPDQIDWYTCGKCQMIYGDGSFTQSDLDTYYRERYGYGINSPANIQRLKSDAAMIATALGSENTNACIVDFGGAGDDGKSVLVEELLWRGFAGAVCVGVGDALPAECDVIYASHVIEHVYDLPETMRTISAALKPDGLLIIDVPDATGLLQQWKMPILDFNTKHVNHFTLRTLLELGHRHGFESVKVRPYELENAPAYQVYFKRLGVAYESAWHITANIGRRIEKLREIHEPVNVWGLGDITWHILSQVDLDVLDYIDNDPAYRQATYSGKPVQERPVNSAPIVILAQGQRGRLIANIRAAGVTNQIIEV